MSLLVLQNIPLSKRKRASYLSLLFDVLNVSIRYQRYSLCSTLQASLRGIPPFVPFYPGVFLSVYLVGPRCYSGLSDIVVTLDMRYVARHFSKSFLIKLKLVSRRGVLLTTISTKNVRSEEREGFTKIFDDWLNI